MPPDANAGTSGGRSGRIFVGLGSANRHDGGVGLWLARALSDRGLNAICVSNDDAGLLETLNTHSDVVLIDASQAGHAPGHVTRIDAASGPVPIDILRHGHGSLGSGEIVEAARSLGCLPPRLLLIGIEGQDFSEGQGLSPQVEWAAWQLLREFSAGARPEGPP